MQAIISALLALSFLLSTLAAPLPHSHHSHSYHSHSHHSHSSKPSLAEVVERTSNSSSTSSQKTFLAKSPHWVTYSDSDPNTPRVVPPASELTGFNVFVLAFYLSSGPSDQVQNFISLSETDRTEILQDLHSNGISLMVSVLGSTEAPTTDGVDPSDFAGEVASFVKKYGLDGVDVDYEDFDAMNSKTGSAEKWLVTFTNALRSQLPAGQYFITHAPVAPWFSTDTSTYPHGAYRTVHAEAGDAIDWYNIQYYNQNNIYSTCSHIVSSSPSSSFPNTSVKEINEKTNVPLSKLVIGKPAVSSDADGGQDFMGRAEVAGCLQQAKEELGWDAGAMFWEWPDASVDLISTVRGLSFPVDLGL